MDSLHALDVHGLSVDKDLRLDGPVGVHSLVWVVATLRMNLRCSIAGLCTACTNGGT